MGAPARTIQTAADARASPAGAFSACTAGFASAIVRCAHEEEASAPGDGYFTMSMSLSPPQYLAFDEDTSKMRQLAALLDGPVP
jgi:hypothetical protein